MVIECPRPDKTRLTQTDAVAGIKGARLRPVYVVSPNQPVVSAFAEISAFVELPVKFHAARKSLIRQRARCLETNGDVSCYEPRAVAEHAGLRGGFLRAQLLVSLKAQR